MSGVLVDTSVWVDHFRRRNAALAELLERDLVLSHPLIVGEIACGTPPDRPRTLAALGCLRQVRQASPGAKLWTLDKPLATVARQFDVAFRPSSH